jgi:hypothetical protein
MDRMHEIIVGNIGTVYSGNIAADAGKVYREYVLSSAAATSSSGRAAGEDVTWMRDGEVFREFIGKLHR